MRILLLTAVGVLFAAVGWAQTPYVLWYEQGRVVSQYRVVSSVKAVTDITTCTINQTLVGLSAPAFQHVVGPVHPNGGEIISVQVKYPVAETGKDLVTGLTMEAWCTNAAGIRSPSTPVVTINTVFETTPTVPPTVPPIDPPIDPPTGPDIPGMPSIATPFCPRPVKLREIIHVTAFLRITYFS